MRTANSIAAEMFNDPPGRRNSKLRAGLAGLEMAREAGKREPAGEPKKVKKVVAFGFHFDKLTAPRR